MNTTALGGDQTPKFGFPDLPDFWLDLLSDRDSVYSIEPLFENLTTSEETCSICAGTAVKTCWKFWQSGRAASAGALAPEPPRATRSLTEPRGARRRRALAQRRRALTGSDQSHEDGANRGAPLPEPAESLQKTLFFSHFLS